MKNLFLSLAAFLCLTSLTAAADAPDAYYLVGSINNWTTPNMGGTDYPLLDEDGDGVYTGTYDLVSGNEFKVFTEVCGWENASAFYGCQEGQSEVPVFSNRTNRVTLYNNDKGLDNITPFGSGSGPVTISCKLNENGDMEMEITAPGWAEAPTPPEAIYLVGDFNGWQLPNTNSDNGAYKFTAEDASSPQKFLVKHYFVPEGENLNFGLIYRASGASQFYAITAPYTVPFTILNESDGSLKRYDYTYTPSYGVFHRKGQKFQIMDFQGGYLTFEINTDLSKCTYYSESAPALTTPERFYAVININDEIMRQSLLWDGVTNPSEQLEEIVNLSNVKGKEITLFFTSENSIAPAADKIWGFANDATITRDPSEISLIKGGEPLHVDFDSETKLKIRLNIYSNVVTTETEVLITDLPYIYLTGYQINWPSPSMANADELIKLYNNGNGIFEEEIECPYVDDGTLMNFRFYTGLEGWTSTYSLGADYIDFYNLGIDMENTPCTYPIYEQGLSSWCLENWQGGKVKMSVDLNTMQLTISNPAAGIDEVETDSADGSEPIYYNIQGIRIDKPEKGVVIKHQNGKATKMIVR